jgi:hypothetical protein
MNGETMFQNVILLITALWLLFACAMMDTNNFPSFLMFKFIPFVLGGLVGMIALKGFGVI